MRNLFTLILTSTFVLHACGGGSSNLEESRRTGTETHESANLEESRRTGTETQEKSQPDSENPSDVADTKTGQKPTPTKFIQETLPSALDSDAYSDGVLFHISNRLATYKPRLSATVCSSTQGKDRLCFVSDKLISYNERASFYLSADNLRRLHSFSGNNEISVRFNDDHSRSLIHWHCWEQPSLKVDADSSLVTLNVEVTQVNIASYSCVIH